jgi:regulator of sirC expression with transglutaminase-like and TPR domain
VAPRDSGPPAVARSPEQALEAYRRGNERLLAGDAAAAQQAFAQAVALDPILAVGHRGLGLAEAQLGHRAASVRALRRYLRLAPGAPDREPIGRRIQLLAGGN